MRSNQLLDLLTYWHQHQDQQWVLGTIVETDGSSYRKAGAMLLINELGQYFGLLSGGCLEADIMLKAQQVFDSQTPKFIQYDMRDDDDISWQLGIGCGGMVRILLQPVNQENNQQALLAAYQALEQGNTCYYQINTAQPEQANQLVTTNSPAENCLTIECKPSPRIAVFGGGIDARPVVQMAAQLGWQVIVIDHRTNNARQTYFSNAKQIIKRHPNDLTDADFLQAIDAAVVMGHNIEFDAAAVKILQTSSCQYLGLLGPVDRKNRVLKAAKLSNSVKPLFGPIGLNIGGRLPESIALSILSEIQAVLEQKDLSKLTSHSKLIQLANDGLDELAS